MSTADTWSGCEAWIQVCNWNDGAAERAAWSDFADGS